METAEKEKLLMLYVERINILMLLDITAVVMLVTPFIIMVRNL